MRRFFLYILFLISVQLVSAQQQKIYLDDGSYEIGMLKDGKKEGKWKKYYASGKLFISSHYTNGKLNGLVTLWYVSGKKQNESTYIDGKLTGTSISYDSNGLITEEISYKNNAINGLCKYYKEGKLYRSYYLNSNGTITQEKYYTSSKKPIKVGEKTGKFY